MRARVEANRLGSKTTSPQSLQRHRTAPVDGYPADPAARELCSTLSAGQGLADVALVHSSVPPLQDAYPLCASVCSIRQGRVSRAPRAVAVAVVASCALAAFGGWGSPERRTAWAHGTLSGALPPRRSRGRPSRCPRLIDAEDDIEVVGEAGHRRAGAGEVPATRPGCRGPRRALARRRRDRRCASSGPATATSRPDADVVLRRRSARAGHRGGHVRLSAEEDRGTDIVEAVRRWREASRCSMRPSQSGLPANCAGPRGGRAAGPTRGPGTQDPRADRDGLTTARSPPESPGREDGQELRVDLLAKLGMERRPGGRLRAWLEHRTRPAHIPIWRPATGVAAGDELVTTSSSRKRPTTCPYGRPPEPACVRAVANVGCRFRDRRPERASRPCRPRSSPAAVAAGARSMVARSTTPQAPERTTEAVHQLTQRAPRPHGPRVRRWWSASRASRHGPAARPGGHQGGRLLGALVPR